MRLTDEAVQALRDGATPGRWHAEIQPSDIGGHRCAVVRLPSGAPDDGGDILAELWSGPGDARLIAAAPDLARDLLDARAEIAELRATLAAERGDPAGALPGWTWDGDRWLLGGRQRPAATARLWIHEGAGHAEGYWSWCVFRGPGTDAIGRALTAREAMRAAGAAIAEART